MITETNPLKHNHTYYRLVTLWVICEAFAGGIMHGVKLPFSGLIVSSLAVTCIILIAFYVPSKTAILKATVIVAVFKLMLSPHSPPTAYIAVFFQGLMGQLLFGKKYFFKAAAIILAILSLVESGIQRILVLMIVYGNEFWKALNQFIQKLTGEKTLTNYSLSIAAIYILIHAIAGIFVGIYAASLAMKSRGWHLSYPELIIPAKNEETSVQQPHKRNKKKTKLIFILLWLILLATFIHAQFYPAKAFLPAGQISMIIFRSVLIVAGWYLILAPLTMILIKKMLSRQKLKNQSEINKVTKLLPQTKYIFIQSWHLSAEEKGLKRLRTFLKILMINILTAEVPKPS